MKSLTGCSVVLASLLASSYAAAQAVPFSDALVQSPELAPPSRGSIAGQYASVAIGPADVSRGAYALPLPISLPSERGGAAVSFVPAYSPDAAISEWGAGWATPDLSIFRTRISGDLDYSTDDRTGPWGRMVKGTDGAWYPVGLKSLVRVEESGTDLVAYLADGSQWTFTAADGITTARGTYAWSLKTAVTVLGRTTAFAWTKNASGRPSLSTVTWGGTNPAAPQYRATFDYEALPLPISDYRAGQAVLLDRRIKTVHVAARQGASFVDRHRYTLAFQQDGGSPTFYLGSIQQTFADGTQAPAVTYGYQLSRDYFAKATGQRIPKLDSIIQQYGTDVFLPNRSTAFDADLDGRPDLEFQFDNRLLRQTDTGYVVETLPTLAANANAMCRRAPSAYNAPRMIARFRAGIDDENVVAFVGDGTRTHTSVAVCDRSGLTQWQSSLTGDWTLGANTRLVDLNRDHQPDLVRVYSGGYEAMPNASTPTTFGYGTSVKGVLTPVIQPDTTWIHDINGDGIPDLVSRFATGLVAWMGKGNLQYESQGKTFAVLNASGQSIPNLKAYQVVFFDANNDGITDLLLANGASMMLFANNGNAFVSMPVPYFQSSTWSSVKPVILDVAGNGNTEIAYVQGGLTYGVDLDAPGVGLLTSADDGRGTVVSFDYQRAAPEVGVRNRNSLIAQFKITTVGYDPLTYAYTFQKPDVHSVGKFLLGYEGVTRRGSIDSSSMTFMNPDTAPGTLLSSVDHDDLTPLIDQVSFHTYDDVLVRGVPWKRPKTDTRGYRVSGTSTTKLVETDYLAYDRDVCPTQMRETGSSGTLTTVRTIAAPSAMARSLACVPSHTLLTGSHADPTLDFRHEADMPRNDVGQLTSLVMLDGHGSSLLKERVTYGTDRLVTSVFSPDKGTATFAWVPGTEMLDHVVGADGVVKQVIDRDPLTDAVRGLSTNRGTLSYSDYFRFDGRERLIKSWNTLGKATETTPIRKFVYRDATATLPAFVETDTLIDAATGTYARSGELFTGKEESIAKAHRIPEGWAFDRLVGRVASQRQATAYVKPTTTTELGALDMTTLFTGAQPVGTTRISLAGDKVSASQKLHADVERNVTSTFALAGNLVRTELENGTLARTTTTDEARHVVAEKDQAGATTQYVYDALGRIRRAILADGTKHAVALDDMARLSVVTRDGVGKVTYSYEPTTGLLSGKSFVSPAGVSQRDVQYAYDSIGRVTVETDTARPSGSTQSFQHYYDGASPTAPTATGARGLETGLLGDEYVRTDDYRADGSIAKTTVVIANQRAVTTAYGYADDGTKKDKTLTIADGRGTVLGTSTEAFPRDTYGRASGLNVDGAALASYSYDVNGLPLWATYAAPVGHQEVVTLSHDSLTRALLGMNQNATSWSSASSLRFNTRGLVDHEDTNVGGTARTRTYGYGPQGYLTASSDADGTYAYQFDTSGLPSKIDASAGGITESRAFQRQSDLLTAGAHHHRFDSIGRAIEVDDLAVTYGPNGQIASATRGGKQWSYVYDDKGQRVAKLRAGEIAATYLPDGSFVDGTTRTEPVKFAGRVVGVLRQKLGAGGTKTFSLVASDARGSALSDAEGARRPQSPFGERTTHSDVSDALDYAEKGFDSDLGLLRVGVRDYDTRMNRFTTPDPLFLEHIEKCPGSSVECALYTYARNNPLVFVDPTGNAGQGVSFGFGGGYTFGIGDDYVSYSFEVGVVFNFDKGYPDGHFYSSESEASPAKSGTYAVGASGGVGFAANYIVDTAQFDGNGKQVTISAPIPLGGQVLLTPDGNSNGVGFNVGKSMGASFAVSNGNTTLHPAPSIIADAPPATATDTTDATQLMSPEPPDPAQAPASEPAPAQSPITPGVCGGADMTHE